MILVYEKTVETHYKAILTLLKSLKTVSEKYRATTLFSPQSHKNAPNAFDSTRGGVLSFSPFYRHKNGSVKPFSNFFSTFFGFFSLILFFVFSLSNNTTKIPQEAVQYTRKIPRFCNPSYNSFLEYRLLHTKR